MLPSKIPIVALLCLSALLLLDCSNAFAGGKLVDLQVNYQSTPLGIDVESPRFSWRMEDDSDQRGILQQTYQLLVVDEAGKTVWDTKQVSDQRSLGIVYAGAPLQATTRYTWTIKVGRADGMELTETSWFETGLMNADPDLSAWEGATWIGGAEEDMVLQASYLSVFQLEYVLQLDKESGSTKAAFLFGGNDDRLMDQDLNLKGVEVGENESYLALELDISAVASGGQAQLNVYRIGYAPEDEANRPLFTLPIADSLIHEANLYAPHAFKVRAVFGSIEIFLQGQEKAHDLTANQAGGGFGQVGINLNPYGRGGDFICFPVLGDIGFRMEPGQKARFSKLKIRNYRQPSNVLFEEKVATGQAYQGIFETAELDQEGYLVLGGETGWLELADPSRNAAPMLRTEFDTEAKPIQKARLYATARGIYELYLNGQRVGDDYFNPGLTQYNKTHLYQTYEVTDLIREGAENALGAWMSEGWWSGSITFRGENWNFFGDRQSLLAKLVITYEDGTEKVITTQPNHWRLFTDGPIRYGSFFQGEVYDARKEAEIAGWSTADFDDSAWKAAVAVPLEGTSVIGEFRNFMGRPVPLSYDEQQLIGQIGETASIVTTLQAQEVEEVRPGVFVYDMGQNMVGFPRLTLTDGTAGQTIRLRYAEVTYPDLKEHEGDAGMIMLENIRAALTQDLYVLKGGAEVIQPRFTFHGYRYLEITGIEKALPLSAVQGQVLSSVSELSSRYETSHSLVNRLWENITWSLRGNFLSIPTDTPARNERMGWNGDINVFSRAATWLADVNQFLRRHLRAMRDMQAENGRFSDVAPVGNGFGGTLWGSAGIIVAWETYQQYGDESLLAEHYDAMKAYVDFLETKQEASGVLIEGPLGDWLSPENSKNDNTLLWAAYQSYNLRIMHQVATLLEKKEDAEEFLQRYEARKAFLNDRYFDPTTHKSVMSGVVAPGFGPPPANPPKQGDVMDTQASYAIPLAFDLLNPAHESAAVAHLAATIVRSNVDDLGVERPPYSLMTGFIGTASIGDALSKHGKDELAYRLLQSETYPSWLYPVKNGATTIWERLNSYTIEDGFGGNNSMNSFNHYSFGAIASWMYNYSLGIQRDPQRPGFQHFFLQPTPDPTQQMTFAKGYYDSMYGRIVSEWYLEERGIRYVMVVPPNTTASLSLQAKSRKQVKEGGKALKKVAGIQLLDVEEGQVKMELGSGRYEFWVVE